jgi:hypothetical protein
MGSGDHARWITAEPSRCDTYVIFQYDAFALLQSRCAKYIWPCSGAEHLFFPQPSRVAQSSSGLLLPTNSISGFNA